MAVGELVTRTGVTLSTKLRAQFLAIGAITGTFAYGESVSGGTSSATGQLIATEAGKLFLYDIVGTFESGEVITGATSSATATSSAVVATGWQAAFTTLARVRDSVSVNRSRAVQEITDFDSAEYEFADKIAGNQSANASFTMNLVPGGTSFQQVEASMDGNLDICLKRAQVDRQGTTTRTRYYTAIVTGFNEADSVTDASTVAVTIELSDVSKTDPTT